MEKENISFPPAHFADSEGLLAEGGEVSSSWLLEAYKNGYYLWNSPMSYPKWWTPDPRIVLFPKELAIPQYVSEEIEKAGFKVTFNQDLEGVMKLIQSIENKEEMNILQLQIASLEQKIKLMDKPKDENCEEKCRETERRRIADKEQFENEIKRNKRENELKMREIKREEEEQAQQSRKYKSSCHELLF